MNIPEIAKQLKEEKENIILAYAFNATGKTRLCVGYKDFTKSENQGNHAGIYYNAFSEDLFIWENDEENDNENIRLTIKYSSLSQYHSYLDAADVENKLAIYNPKYKFDFNLHDDPEMGIESVTFFIDEETRTPIKISRGEERIFVWCFFLALFEIDDWSGNQDAHIYIDDPVSSLDEHNIFITVASIIELIEKNYIKKRIIVTTHHIGLFSILCNKLTKGEKKGTYENLVKTFILKQEDNKLKLVPLRKDVFLFHLHLMQTLDTAIKTELFAYHFVLLRQLLENIASFLGTGRVGFVLEEIGVEDANQKQEIINTLSHKNIFRYEFEKMNPEDENLFKEIFEGIRTKYHFQY